MHATVGVHEVVFVVVTEERSEPEAFDVKIAMREKPGAPRSQCGINTIAAVLVGVEFYGAVMIEINFTVNRSK